MIEIYGYKKCPFAWRTRLAAREKGVAYEWLPTDVETPDPRVAAKNPEKKSPLLVEGDYTLTESMVIAQYVNEAFPGRALLPDGARERADARVLIAKLSGFERGGGDLGDAKVREALEKAARTLDEALGTKGSSWLGGSEPSLVDVAVIPMVRQALARGFEWPDGCDRARAYGERAIERESVQVSQKG